MRILFLIAFTILTTTTFAQSKGLYMQGNNLYMVAASGDTVLINSAGGAVSFGAITGQPTDNTNLTTALNTRLAVAGNGSQLTGITQNQITNLVNDLLAKQPTLVSGTNIKSFNGEPLLGTGDIPMKTVNGVSVVGSGDIIVGGGSSPTLITLANNYSSSSTTMANVTGWDFPVTIGKIYRIEVIGDYQSSQATTTGCKFGIALSGGADGTVKGSARGTVTAAAAATELVIPIRAISGTGSFLQTSGVNAVNTPQAVSMVISFTCTASGTFNIQFGSEVNTSETRLNLGSSLIYQILN